MNYFCKAIVGATLGLVTSVANAASMDPLDPLANNGFDAAEVLLSMDPGDAFYFNSSSAPSLEFFSANAGTASDPYFEVSSGDLDNPDAFDPFDPFSAPTFFATIGMTTIELLGAEDVYISDVLAQFLFIDAATNTGYLAEFEIDPTDPNLDPLFDSIGLFTDPDADIAMPASATLTRYSVAAVPLPASLPLVFVGLGGLMIAGRRKKAAKA